MRRPRIFCGMPGAAVGGVHVFTGNLLRGLAGMGYETGIIMPRVCASRHPGHLAPKDIRVINLDMMWYESPRVRWQATARMLTKHKPCIYLPGFDWGSAWKSVSLGASIRVVGVLHADQECYYELTRALGCHFDAIVSPTHAIAEQVRERFPAVDSRLTIIPYGVPCPDNIVPRDQSPSRCLKIIFAARLVQYQKRVLDVPRIIAELDRRRIPFELTIIGEGPEERELADACAPWAAKGIVSVRPATSNEELNHLFALHDVFLLTSDFEGLPLALLQAMSRGCVPVVTNIRSGIPDVVHDTENGFRVPVGDIGAFATRLDELQRHSGLRYQMAERAHRTIRRGGYSQSDMCQRYADLFDRIAERGDGGMMVGPAKLPRLPECQLRFRDYLPLPLARALRVGRDILRRAFAK